MSCDEALTVEVLADDDHFEVSFTTGRYAVLRADTTQQAAGSAQRVRGPSRARVDRALQLHITSTCCVCWLCGAPTDLSLMTWRCSGWKAAVSFSRIVRSTGPLDVDSIEVDMGETDMGAKSCE